MNSNPQINIFSKQIEASSIHQHSNWLAKIKIISTKHNQLHRFQIYPSKILLIETSPNHIHFRSEVKSPNQHLKQTNRSLTKVIYTPIHLQSYRSGKIKIISNKHNQSHGFQSILYFSYTNTNSVWLIGEANAQNRIAVSYINPDTVKSYKKGQNKLPVYSVVAGKRPHWLQNGWKGIMFSVERGEVQDNFRCTTMSPWMRQWNVQKYI